jgi:two-component system, NtrC family, sensor kinase
MKIEHKIYLSNVINLGMIAIIGLFALYSFDQIMTKFRFTGIADKLNASLLEMRLLEKNYFLYNDPATLREISRNIQTISRTIDEVEKDVIRAVGNDKYWKLKDMVNDYQNQVNLLLKNAQAANDSRASLRAVGQRLKLYSENITDLEREQVAGIIKKTRTVMAVSFWFVILSAFLLSAFIVRRIRRSLRRIVSLTQSIPKGNYEKIGTPPPPDEMGSVIKAINAMADELEKREQALVQSRRLASIGVLVAGVAHELNNPLNNISVIAQTYNEVYDKLEKEQRIHFMEQIDEQADRLRVIIKNLLDFAKPKPPSLQEQDINTVIQNSLELIQNMLNISNIRVRLNLAQPLPSICIDEHQFQQVLVNLFTNAIQAMGAGGELGISTSLRQEEDEVRIRISDTGQGIDPTFLEHIFDPFFTTKEEGGTGLGLWVSYGIVKSHQGSIEVQSTVGEGTVFTIDVPTSRKSTRCANDKS